MPGPARAGLMLYAKDVARLERFYGDIAVMRRLHADDHIAVLESADLQLVLHVIPPHIAADITITTPPQRREDTALKFFFTVDGTLDALAPRIAAHGGVLFEERWNGPGFVAANAMDPEGNVLQVRETKSG